jgi:site-specific DNA recombinase
VRVILYARVSTRGQAERGYSLRQQVEALRTYAESKGYDLLTEITDDGYSGMTLDRPGLDHVRELVEMGDVDLVLAQDRDRFAREPAYIYILKRELAEHGTKLKALNDKGDDSPVGELTDGILDQLSKYERALITERTRRGKLRRAKEGKIVPAGRPPLGFVYANDRYEVDEPSMRLVRRIFEMAANGTSLHRIRKTFEDEGITTAGSTRKPEGSRYWNINSIRRVILNDVYHARSYDEVRELVSPDVAAKLDPNQSYGISWYNRHTTNSLNGKRRKGAEKPRAEWIAVAVPDAGIPRDSVDRARASLKGERPSRANNRFWELSGHAVCRCGCKLVSRITHKAGKKYPYYVCSRYMRNGSESCPDGRWLNANKLETDVYWALQQIKPQDLEAQIQQLLDKERAPEEEIKAEHRALEDVARQRARFQQMAARELISLDELEVHLADLDNRKAAAHRRLVMLQTTTDQVERLKLIQRNPILTFVAQTPDMRRDYYRELELRVMTDKNGAQIKGVFGCQNVAPTSTSGTER